MVSLWVQTITDKNTKKFTLKHVVQVVGCDHQQLERVDSIILGFLRCVFVQPTSDYPTCCAAQYQRHLHFLGPQKTNDVIISHMITYLKLEGRDADVESAVAHVLSVQTSLCEDAHVGAREPNAVLPTCGYDEVWCLVFRCRVWLMYA